MLLSEVYSTLADTYETIDFRMVLVENAETHEQDLVFLKTVWCMDSEIKEDKKWDFYHKLNEDSRLQFVHKLIEKKNIQKFFDDLTNGIIQIDDSLIELSDMEKLYLSSDFKINQLYAYLPELYPKDVEYPSLLMRPNYDNNCSSILNSNGMPLQINGIETLKIVESFLDVKGTILINSRIVAMLPIYCKLYDYNGPTIEFNDKLVDRLNLLVMNDEIKSIPFGSISYTSNKGMNKFGLKRYFEHGNEKINVLFNPLELIIINHENESLIELQNLNILGTDSETNEKLISIAENQRLEKKSSFRYNHHKNQVDDGLPFTIMKTIASMLNSDGGVLLLGVSDDNQTIGLEKDFENLPNRKDKDGFENLFRNLVRDKYFKMDYVNTLLQLLFPQVNSKIICKIIISKSSKPIFLLDDDKCNVFFTRQGNGVRKLDGLDLSEYLSNFVNRNNIIYDLIDHTGLE